MKTFYWGAFYVALSLLLSACQTHTHKTSDVVVSAGNLAQYNLFLPYANASFDSQSLTIKGGIRNKTTPSHLACGYLDIQLFNKEGVLINTLTTDYSPAFYISVQRLNARGIFQYRLPIFHHSHSQ